MATSNLKSPPVFIPEDDEYLSWKNDIQVWKAFTDTKEEKIGPAIYLTLKGRAREAARSIKVEDLSKPEGYQLIMAAMDKIFLTDETSRAFCAFKEFYEYKRVSGEGFSEFIVEFEKRYNKIARYDMKLPEGVQAFFLLKAANLNDETEKLARAVSSLEYKDMREKIQKIFGDPGILSNKEEVPIVKEDVLYGEGYYRGGNRGRGRSRNRGGGFNRGNRGSGRGAAQSQNQYRCYECDSTKHFANQCPHRQNKNEEVHYVQQQGSEETLLNVHVTLINLKTETLRGSLLKETFGKGLLDTGCSKTVSGKVWMDEFVQTLSRQDAVNIKENTSKSIFRFGDGVESNSMRMMTIPVYIGKKRVLMDVDVVEHDIPLLISKGAMKQLKMKLDFEQDKASIGNQEIKLNCTSTGHYCMPLAIHPDNQEVNFVFKLDNLVGMKREEMKRKATKLHKQFSHASQEKLTKLLKDSGCENTEFLQILAECCQQCDICHKYKKTPLRPIVGFSLGKQFNDTVCMDLKEFEHLKIWILHLIDASSRYTAACLINTKKKEVVVAAIFRIWIMYFGCPRRFMSDNGGEFANDVFIEMNEKLGVETITTAAESPFSNGTVERHNGILYETMKKTIDETSCSPDLALAWAVSAKNALQNAGGYSPNQLVFGTNTNMPSVLSAAPPALESTTSADIVRKNLDALHSARKNYIEAESSDKIRRALRCKVRSYADKHYEISQKVFYKRNGYKNWRGPGVVVGLEGKTVLVRHGSYYYRCHPCHIMSEKPVSIEAKNVAKEVKEGSSEKKKNANGSSASDERKSVSRSPDIDSSDSEDEPVSTQAENELSDDTNVQQSEPVSIQAENELSGDTNLQQDESVNEQSIHDVNDEVQQTESISEETEHEAEHELPDDGNEDEASHITHTQQKSSTRSNDQEQAESSASCSSFLEHQQIPSRGKTVEYQLSEGSIVRAKILSTQPKKSKYLTKKWGGQWLNVQIEGESHPSSVNWDKVVHWKEIQEVYQVIVLNETEELDPQVIEAKEEEIKKLMKNDTFKIVPYNKQSVISTKWVFHQKEKDGIPFIKARLVARGFEEDTSDMKLDSPTCSRQALRLLFMTAATKRWQVKSIDIASAFLQGKSIERDVYLNPPDDYRIEGEVWKLNQCIYGLNDAPRSWYDRVKQVLVNLGGKRSSYDNALFCWYSSLGSLEGIMVLHVDDFQFCGTKDWEEKVVKEICKTFEISSQHSGTFRYVGLNVSQHDDAVFIDQIDYTRDLKEIPISSNRQKQKDSLLTEEEVSDLRSASGQLLWAATHTRPDAAYDACVVANRGNQPTVRNILVANKALRKIRTHEYKLVFPNLGKPEKIEIVAYSDASHGALPSGASQGGCIIFARGENDTLAPILWQSKKLPRVPKSPLAAETMMIAETADAGFCMATMIKEVFALKTLPTVRVMTDSKSLIDHLESSRVISDTRMRVDIARIREIVNLKEAHISWVPKEEQLADPLTKQGASTTKLLEVLNGQQ